MKIARLFSYALVVGVAGGCRSPSETHARDSSLEVLGIHTFVVNTKNTDGITLFLEEGEVRSELISTEVNFKQVVVRIQFGLPEEKMRVAIGNENGAVASDFASDVFSAHPYTFSMTSKPIVGEKVLIETKQDEVEERSRIIVKLN